MTCFKQRKYYRTRNIMNDRHLIVEKQPQANNNLRDGTETSSSAVVATEAL